MFFNEELHLNKDDDKYNKKSPMLPIQTDNELRTDCFSCQCSVTLFF